MENQLKYELAKTYIKNANAILITAGAGMGVDSGLPDFRGTEGFWQAYPPIKKLGLNFSEMANPKWFTTNPTLAWAFYGHRLNIYRKTIPHDGFKILLDLVTQNNYFIYTSNVDGHFQKANFASDKIVEVHGSIYNFQCTEDCNDEIWDATDEKINVDMENFKALNIPKCHNCGAVSRPNILMFGDWEWNSKRTEIQGENFSKWFSSIKRENQQLAIIEIGAGTTIPTIRRLGEKIAKSYKNSKLIRINPRDFAINENIGYSIKLGGLEGIKAVIG